MEDLETGLLLPTGQKAETKEKIRIVVSEPDTMTGIRKFSNLFGINGLSTNPEVLHGVFSTGSQGEWRGNYLFGDRGVITHTWKYLRLVLNKSADLIQKLMTAVRQLFIQNQELKKQLFVQNRDFMAQLHKSDFEKQQAEKAAVRAQADAYQACEYAKQADLLIRNLPDETAQRKKAAAENKRCKKPAPSRKLSVTASSAALRPRRTG